MWQYSSGSVGSSEQSRQSLSQSSSAHLLTTAFMSSRVIYWRVVVPPYMSSRSVVVVIAVVVAIIVAIVVNAVMVLTCNDGVQMLQGSHLWKLARHEPWAVRNRFSSVHDWRGRLKPGCWMEG